MNMDPVPYKVSVDGILPDDVTKTVCLRGRGAECCIYLLFGDTGTGIGPQWQCCKFDTMAVAVERRRDRMTAKRTGDCERA